MASSPCRVTAGSISAQCSSRGRRLALGDQVPIYVSDGYGNARVHKHSPEGKLVMMSWGEPGTGEGEFNIVHNICCDADGPEPTVSR
jgi:hypothetical protein